MPYVVLRNKTLPRQPIVKNIPVGQNISRGLKEAGWEIDADTTPEAARAENAAYSAEKAAQVAAAEALFVPQFAGDDDDAPPAKPVKSLDTTTSEQGDPLDTKKE